MKCENFESSFSKLSSIEIFSKWESEVRPMIENDETFFHAKDVYLDLKPIWRLNSFNGNGVLRL